jgi:hypothetical protein
MHDTVSNTIQNYEGDGAQMGRTEEIAFGQPVV